MTTTPTFTISRMGRGRQRGRWYPVVTVLDPRDAYTLRADLCGGRRDYVVSFAGMRAAPT